MDAARWLVDRIPFVGTLAIGFGLLAWHASEHSGYGPADVEARARLAENQVHTAPRVELEAWLGERSLKVENPRRAFSEWIGACAAWDWSPSPNVEWANILDGICPETGQTVHVVVDRQNGRPTRLYLRTPERGTLTALLRYP